MSPPAFLGSGLVGLGTKFALLRDVLGTSRPPEKDESIADFVRRKFSAQMLDRLVVPFVSGVYAGDPEKLTFAIDGAVAEARTGAFFANNQAPLTSRTIQFISQTTITQREVDSDPNVPDPNSAQRGPGFVAPTLVARKLATLDALAGGGRVAIHHITGGDEADQQRDGDFADHDRRYARTAEFMDVLRRELTAPEPFDFDGEFYRFQGAISTVRPLHEGSIPIYFGGQSDAAVRVGGQHAPARRDGAGPCAARALSPRERR